MDTLKISKLDLEPDRRDPFLLEAARESEDRLRTLIDAMPDLVCFKDGEGRWQVANPTTLRLLQLEDLDYRGKKDAELARLVRPCQDAFLTCQTTDEQAWSKGEPVHSEERIPGPDGVPLLFDVLKVPVFHPDGRRKGLVVLGRDITRRRAIEEELLHSRKLDSLITLAGGISHDFNNILTAILGNISMARMFAEEERMQELLGRAEAASLKAKALVQQLLNFARSGTPIKKQTGISTLIRETASFVLRGSNVRCQFSLSAELWPVAVDEGQISQALHNVIANADQAMPEGGIIEVSGENLILPESEAPRAGRYVRISVEDHGTGIDPRYLGRIFDPYFSTKQKGCGLGLAISYSIIKNHQGFITVKSEQGVGTTLSLHLPAAQKETEEVEPAPEPGELRASTCKVLLMDDDPMVRDVAGDMLVSLGYGADFAVDGAEALEKYRSARESGNGFGVVVLDLTVPGGMGARRTLQLLRQLDPQVQAVVTSGYANDPVLLAPREHGFAAAITKPFDLRELGAVLRALRLAAAAAPEQHRAHPAVQQPAE